MDQNPDTNQPQTPDMASLLTSSEKSRQMDGLNRLAVSGDYGFFLECTALTHSIHREVADLALRVSIYLAEKYLTDPFITAGGTRLLWAKIIMEKHRPDFIADTRAKLDSTDPKEQIAGLCGIRHFITNQEAVELLARFIKHPDHRVRATACSQIGMMAGPAGADIMSNFLLDSDNRVIANAIETMDKSRNPEFVQYFERFKHHKNNRTRANALVALFNCGRIDLTGDFKKMLKSKEALMRTSAVWAIGEIGREDCRYYPLLKTVLKDTDPLVRKNIVNACAKAISPVEIEFLLKPMLKRYPEMRGNPRLASWIASRTKKKAK